MNSSEVQSIRTIITTTLIERGIDILVGRPKLIDGGFAKILAFPVSPFSKDISKATNDGGLEFVLSSRLQKTVFLVRTNSLFVVVVLERANLPERVELEDIVPGRFKIGLDSRGQEIANDWKDLGHVLVSGMTGSGKSVLLRSIVAQALFSGFKTVLIDADEMTFAPFVNHDRLITPVGNIMTAEESVRKVLEIINKRGQEFRKLLEGGKVFEDMWQLNDKYNTGFSPILLAIDEANSLIDALGGINGDFSQTLKQIVWRGRKFGVVAIVSGQTFEKAVVGGMRDQLATRISFKVANSSISRIVLGRSGAEKIKLPGRALTNKWGLIQTYVISNSFLIIPRDNNIQYNLTELEAKIVEKYAGEILTYNILKNEFQLSQRQANKIRKQMLAKGLVEKAEHNSLRVIKS